MGKEALQGLGVLRTLSPPSSDDEPDHNWSRHLAAEHIVPLGSIVDELIEGQKEEIHPLMGHDRAHSANRRANSNPGHRVFRGRHIHYPIRAIFFSKSIKSAENAFWIRNAESHEINARI